MRKLWRSDAARINNTRREQQERDEHNAIVSYANTIQNETGCTRSEALRVAEERFKKEKK